MDNNKEGGLLGITIDLFNPARDSIDEITELLHEAYAILVDMGFNYLAASQSNAITEERLMSGMGYILRVQGQVKGTVTYYAQVPVSEESIYPAFYKQAHVAHFAQFAVSPAVQGMGIGTRLLECVEQRASQDGKREIACDTAEGAGQLIAYYLKRGYRQIGYQKWPHAVYRSVILSKECV